MLLLLLLVFFCLSVYNRAVLAVKLTLHNGMHEARRPFIERLNLVVVVSFGCCSSFRCCVRRVVFFFRLVYKLTLGVNFNVIFVLKQTSAR